MPQHAGLLLVEHAQQPLMAAPQVRTKPQVSNDVLERAFLRLASLRFARALEAAG